MLISVLLMLIMVVMMLIYILLMLIVFPSAVDKYNKKNIVNTSYRVENEVLVCRYDVDETPI